MSVSTVVVLAVAVGAARIAWRRGARLVAFGLGTFAAPPALALFRAAPWWLLALLAVPVAVLLRHSHGRTSATVVRAAPSAHRPSSATL